MGAFLRQRANEIGDGESILRKRHSVLASLVALFAGMTTARLQAAAPITAPWPAAHGLEAPAGCAIPEPSATRRVFYVDPVQGSASGDGSEAKPWNSLSDVVTKGFISTMPTYYDNDTKKKVYVRPDAPIHPGDVILLKSGNYGNIRIQGYYGAADRALVGFDNPDFITIEAAPGAAPVIGNLLIEGGGKWLFHGLTFENIAPNLDKHSRGALVSFEGPHHDIIFDRNTLLSQADTHNWTQADWLTNASDGVFDYGGAYDGASCITISNNNFVNLGSGMQTQRSNKVLIKGNSINYFIHDGIDYGSNNLIIQNNVEANHIDAGDIARVHPDFMQGQSWGCKSNGENCDSLSDILIDSNICIRQTDVNLPFAKESLIAGNINGIDAFDGQWYNLRVTNNIVVTTSYHGISFFGVHNAVIANNTVLGDENSQTIIPWITVHKQKNGTVSSDVVIRNNITSALVFSDETTELFVDHNICVATNGKCVITSSVGGKVTRDSKPGPHSGNNVITEYGAAHLFNNFTLVNGAVTGFDLHLKERTHAVATGKSELAPTHDIAGALRTVPYDLGAFMFAQAASTATTSKTSP